MTWMTSIVRNRCLDWLRRPNPQPIDGLSHAELARHLREPLGTVKTWVRRGRPPEELP